MVARRVRAHDGVSSPSLDVPAGRRWSRTKASTGPSYFGYKKKQSISLIVIQPVSINVSKSVFHSFYLSVSRSVSSLGSLVLTTELKT